jgi:hypothetical protein
MTFGQGSGVVGTLYVGLVGPAAHFAETIADADRVDNARR